MPSTLVFQRHGLLCSCLAIVCVAGAARAAPPLPQPAADYRALVLAYRSGAHDGALTGVEKLPAGEVRQAAHRLAALADAGTRGGEQLVDPALLKAAAALHADAASNAWSRADAERAGLHLQCGAALVEALVGRRSETERFRRRWFLATALLTARHADRETSLGYFEQALGRLPGDAVLLTAAGWYAERLSFAPAESHPLRRVAVARDLPGLRRQQVAARQRYQRQAIEWLTAATNASSSAYEATLRLARVEASRGRTARARELLTGLVEREPLPPMVAYVGRLLLGRIREQSGEPSEAARLYEEAIALTPPAQSARLALARLKYATDPAAAVAIVDPLLSDAAPGPGDPWSDYQLGYYVLGAILLEDLRQEAGR